MNVYASQNPSSRMPAWTEAGILRLTDRLNAVSCMDGWAVTGVEPYTVLAYVDYA